MQLSELAKTLGLDLRGEGAVEVVAPAPIESAGPGMITFAAGPKYAPILRNSSAAAAIVTAEIADQARCPVLLSANPAFDFARVLQIFFPPVRPRPGIHPTAVIALDDPSGVERFRRRLLRDWR